MIILQKIVLHGLILNAHYTNGQKRMYLRIAQKNKMLPTFSKYIISHKF